MYPDCIAGASLLNPAARFDPTPLIVSGIGALLLALDNGPSLISGKNASLPLPASPFAAQL